VNLAILGLSYQRLVDIDSFRSVVRSVGNCRGRRANGIIEPGTWGMAVWVAHLSRFHPIWFFDHVRRTDGMRSIPRDLVARSSPGRV